MEVAVPVAVAVPLVALGFLYLGAHGKVSDTSAELDAVKAEIAALPAPQGPDIDAGVVGDEAVRATAVASVIGGRLAWDAVFRDLARVLPANVWLTKLSATLPDAGEPGGRSHRACRRRRRPDSLRRRRPRSRSTATRTRSRTSLACSPGSRPSRRSRESR